MAISSCTQPILSLRSYSLVFIQEPCICICLFISAFVGCTVREQILFTVQLQVSRAPAGLQTIGTWTINTLKLSEARDGLFLWSLLMCKLSCVCDQIVLKKSFDMGYLMPMDLQI